MTRKEEIEKMARENAENQLVRCVYIDTIHNCEWADRTMLNRACKWLKEHADDYTWYDETEGESGMKDEFIADFRKAMEE